MIKNKSGFSLIEVMIVIAIVAILTVIGSNSYFQYIIDSKISRGQKFIQDLAEVQERSYSLNKAYMTALPSGLTILPDALENHYSAPSLFLTTSFPSKFTIALMPNRDSPIMARFNPRPNRPSAILLINSEFEKWFESDENCWSTCNCIFDGNDRYWEDTSTSPSDWSVGERSPTAFDNWVCSP